MTKKRELRYEAENVFDNIQIVNSIPEEDLNFILEVYHNKMFAELFQELGRGESGIVYGFDKYVVKIYFTDPINDEDYQFLKVVNDETNFPLLYAYIPKTLMICERIKGYTLREFASNSILYNVAWFEQLFNALKKSLEKNAWIHDLHLDNVIIDQKTKKPRIVDVGSHHFGTFNNDKEKQEFTNVYLVSLVNNLEMHYEDVACGEEIPA